MSNYNKLLCATDFSDPSYEGLKEAVDLAHQFNASLTLVHVIMPMPLMPMTHAFAATGLEVQQYLNNVEASARAELDRLAANHSTP